MKYPNESYDIILEKGLLDSILCKRDPEQDIAKMLKEIYRVLTKKGIYICVSHGEPKKREIYFDKSLWEVIIEVPSLSLEIENENIGKEKKKMDKISEFYCYILKKK